MLLLGSTGFVGARLKADLAGRFEILDPRLELRDAAALKRAVAELRPAAAINAAAMAAPDACERDPQAARQVNALGPQALARACARAGIPLLHFSTDLVFDGTKAPYREEDPTAPISVYGRVKREGEELVLAAHPGACLLRVSLVYGRDGSGRRNFLDHLIAELSAGREIRLFTDQIRTPTPVASIAEVAQRCLSRGLRGVFHWSGAERVSRLEFGRRVCAAFGFDPGLLTPITMAELPSPARRPADCSLDCSRLSSLLGLAPWTLARGLRA